MRAGARAVAAVTGIALGCAVASAASAAQDAGARGPRIVRVGPDGHLPTIALASRVARNGDVVEIDAGLYVDDVAVWPQDGLTIRARGGRVRIESRGAAAEAKAIFVIKGDDVRVEGLEFAGAHVPDRNGAGIRHQGGALTVTDCLFERNEMGILTGNDARSSLRVERSEFRDNATFDRRLEQRSPAHQIYVGAIGRFVLRDSYVHRGAVGHLVKSRARRSDIVNNRLTDEAAGHASYELEFPDGGEAYVLGNVIEQSSRTENPVMIAFGAEGYRWAANELYVVHNTLVDDRAADGRFLSVRAGATRVDVLDNLLVGRGRLEAGAPARLAGNVRAGAADLASRGDHDYRVRKDSRIVGTAVDPGEAHGTGLAPAREYRHPLGSAPVTAAPRTPGALQTLAP